MRRETTVEAVITAHGEAGPAALTATSVSSVSVDPPLLVFSLSWLSSASPAITGADTIVIRLLDADDLFRSSGGHGSSL